MILLLIAMNCAYFSWQVFLNGPVKPDERSLSPLSADVTRLITLEEKDVQQFHPETRIIEDLTATQPPGSVMPLTCQALGPFLAESGMKAFEKRLDRLGVTARSQTRYQREQVGYTVLLPVREYEQAVQIKRRLEKENITVNFVGMDNVLSLGAFRDRSLAEKTLARAQRLGFAPRLEPGYAKRSSYWLVFQRRDNQNESLAGLARKNSDLRVEEMACP